MNIDDLIATAQPRTEVVRICARGDLVARHAEAVQSLAEATRGDDSLSGTPEVRAAAGEVAAIEAEQEASTVTFTLAPVSREQWADLLAKHSPSKEERRAGHDHDPKTFPPAAVHACIIDPSDVTLEQVKTLAGRRADGQPVLPPAEFHKLWAAALMLNLTETPHPKLAAATELLQANEHSSTTSENGASPEVGSLAGGGKQ